MINERITIITLSSPWGNKSYQVLVDNEPIGTYRYLADAKRVGEAHILYLKEREESLREEINDMSGDAD